MKKQEVVDLIDNLLDEWVRYQAARRSITPAQREFKRVLGRRHLKILADRLGIQVTKEEVSSYLQRYRREPNTKYHFVATGYGRNQGRWHIIDGPGFNVEASEEMRQTHMAWMIHDLSARAASDTAHELLPHLAQVPNIEALVERTAEKVKQQLNSLVEDVEASNALYEALTGRAIPGLDRLLDDALTEVDLEMS